MDILNKRSNSVIHNQWSSHIDSFIIKGFSDDQLWMDREGPGIFKMLMSLVCLISFSFFFNY